MRKLFLFWLLAKLAGAALAAPSEETVDTFFHEFKDCVIPHVEERQEELEGRLLDNFDSALQIAQQLNPSINRYNVLQLPQLASTYYSHDDDDDLAAHLYGYFTFTLMESAIFYNHPITPRVRSLVKEGQAVLDKREEMHEEMWLYEKFQKKVQEGTELRGKMWECGDTKYIGTKKCKTACAEYNYVKLQYQFHEGKEAKEVLMSRCNRIREYGARPPEDC